MKLLNIFLSVAILTSGVPSFASFEGLPVERQTILRLKAEDAVQRLYDLSQQRKALEVYALDRGEGLASREKAMAGLGAAYGGIVGFVFGYFPLVVNKTPRLFTSAGLGALIMGTLLYKFEHGLNGEVFNALMEQLPSMSEEERTSLYKKVLVDIEKTDELIIQIDADDRAMNAQ